MEEREVRRQNLFGSDVSSYDSFSVSEWDTLRQTINSKFGAAPSMTPEYATVTTKDPAAEPESDEVQFRLFASGPCQVARVRVRSPDQSIKPAGFVIPRRPDSYYLQDELLDTEKDMIATVSISGQDVIAKSRIPWQGCVLPWRVSTIKQPRLPDLHKSESTSKKKTRPGKKSRIAKRKASAASKLEAEKKQREQEEKDARLRDKKAKVNRQKQLKKRQKEKGKLLLAQSRETTETLV